MRNKNIRIGFLLIFFVVLCSLPVAAQLIGKYTVGSKGPAGEEFVFEGEILEGELVLKDGGLVSDTKKIKGSGQLQYLKGNVQLLLTAEKVISIAREKIVLQIGDDNWQFEVNKHTQFCNGKQRIDWEQIKPGDMVTVVSRVDDMRVGLSVRKGPVLVKKVGGLPVPVDFDCENLK